MNRLLSIAGSDPSGGAGIQLDIKVFHTLGHYGMAVPTALTIQNTQKVKDIFFPNPGITESQIQTLFEDIQIDGVKIGMLGKTELAPIIANVLRSFNSPVVFDPVLVSTTGSRLTEGDIAKLWELIKASHVVTPNVKELLAITQKENIDAAVKEIKELRKISFIITGADQGEDFVTDVLISDGNVEVIKHEKIKTKKETHGTGCCFSSALLCFLSEGKDLYEAYLNAREFVKICLITETEVGKGLIPVNPLNYLRRELMKIEVLERLKKAFKAFKAIPSAYKLIPEIQSNLAEAVIYPLSPQDVAAFPGRIVRVREEVEAVKGPEFGASSHVARIILAANRFDKNIRAAMNIRYKKEWIERLTSSGVFSIESFSRKEEPTSIKEKEGSTLDWGVTLVCERLKGVPDLIYDEGDVGKEPVIRVMGKDALDVVNKVTKLAQILNL